MNQKTAEDELESRMNLNERQLFWNQILNIGQWLLLGKETRDCMEYEQAIKKLGNDITARFQFSTINPTTGTIPSDKKTLKKPIKRNGHAKVHSDYYLYLHVEDIFPECARAEEECHLATDVDVQALELAFHDLIDPEIPFNAKKFIHYIEPGQVEHNVNSLSLNVLSNIFNIKKNMTKDDWIRIKNMYVEFKMKGMIEIKKVCSQVLTMAIRSFPTTSAATWYNRIGNKRKLSALKLGSLFLNVFHVCYMEASQDTKVASLKDFNNVFNLFLEFPNQENANNTDEEKIVTKEIQTLNAGSVAKKQIAQQNRPRLANRTVASNIKKRPSVAQPLDVGRKTYVNANKQRLLKMKSSQLGQRSTSVRRNVLNINNRCKK